MSDSIITRRTLVILALITLATLAGVVLFLNYDTTDDDPQSGARLGQGQAAPTEESLVETPIQDEPTRAPSTEEARQAVSLRLENKSGDVVVGRFTYLIQPEGGKATRHETTNGLIPLDLDTGYYALVVIPDRDLGLVNAKVYFQVSGNEVTLLWNDGRTPQDTERQGYIVMKPINTVALTSNKPGFLSLPKGYYGMSEAQRTAALTSRTSDEALAEADLWGMGVETCSDSYVYAFDPGDKIFAFEQPSTTVQGSAVSWRRPAVGETAWIFACTTDTGANVYFVADCLNIVIPTGEDIQIGRKIEAS